MNPTPVRGGLSGPIRKFAFALAATWAISALALPTHVVLTVSKGAEGAKALPSKLADWHQRGLVSDAFLLDSAGTGDAALAEVAVLEFPNDTCVDTWRQDAGALGAGVTATAADRMATGESFPRDSTKAQFVAVRLGLKQPAAAYRAYVDDCLVPELEGLRAKKILTSYFLFVPKQPSGVFQGLLLLEYRDGIAYQEREKAASDVEETLGKKSDWASLNQARDTFATEESRTLATWCLLPAPDLSDLPSYKPEYHVTGTIRIVGSYLKFSVTALEEAFVHYQPETQFANNFTTSSEGAIGALATGISDLAPAGDDAKITEMMPFFNVYGYVPTELSVATGDYEKRGALWPAAIVVNKDNPLAKISMDELDRTFGSERTGGWDVGQNPSHDILYTAAFARGKETNIRTWGQLGLSGEWADKEIQTYGYCAPGFKIYWERKLFHWSTKYNANFKEYVEPKESEPGPDGQAVSSDAMLKAISADKYGIGWVANFHAKYYPDLKVLAVAPFGGGPAVPYTPENVANHRYPLTRDAFFYVNKEPGRPLDPKVREFMRFILSREGQQIIAHTGFFYPLPPDYLRDQLKKLD